MSKHEGCKRQFTHLKRAWYGSANLPRGKKVDSVTMGFYDEEGGTSGEFSMEWEDLGTHVHPRLCAFDDSWSALWEFRDFLEALAQMDGEDPTPEEICALLESMGVEDDTPEKNPYDASPVSCPTCGQPTSRLEVSGE